MVNWRSRIILILVGVLLLTFLVDRWRRSRIESSQDQNILAAAKKYRVDPALIKAVVWRESRFDPQACGSKGEMGLMQIMEDTSLDWAGAQRVTLPSHYALLDPVKNLDCGTWYLARLLGRYTKTDDPVPYALADYNAGRGNVLKWLKGAALTNSAEFINQIGFPSTRDYVRAVKRQRLKYAGQFSTSSK